MRPHLVSLLSLFFYFGFSAWSSDQTGSTKLADSLKRGNLDLLVGKQTTEIPPDFKAYGSNQDDGIFSQEYEGLGTVFSVIVEADKDKKSRIIRSVIKLPVGKGQSFSSHCKSGDSQVVAVTGPIKGKKRCDGFEPKKAWVLNREKMKFEPTKISSVVCEETDYSVCDD